MWVRSLGREDPLEEGMATHSSILCLENPHEQRSLTGYSLQSMGSQKVGHDCTAQHNLGLFLLTLVYSIFWIKLAWINTRKKKRVSLILTICKMKTEYKNMLFNLATRD